MLSMNESAPTIALKGLSSFSHRQITLFLVIYLAVFGSFASGWHASQPSQRNAFVPVAEAITALPDSTFSGCQSSDSASETTLRVCSGSLPVHGYPQLLDSGFSFLIHGAGQTLMARLDDIARLILPQALHPIQIHDPPPKQPPRSL